MKSIPRAFVEWEVLVVDDERDSLEVAARLLKIAGAKVTTASNGQEALEIVKHHPMQFKFILSDLSMPDMDGWELLYLLKKERPTTGIPIIALTAHAMSGDRERCLRNGMDGYLQKPIQPKELAALLNEQMDAKPLGRES